MKGSVPKYRTQCPTNIVHCEGKHELSDIPYIIRIMYMVRGKLYLGLVDFIHIIQDSFLEI